MFTFSQIKYTRPDIEEIKKSVREEIKKLSQAKSFEEANAAFLNIEKIEEPLATACTLANIRNSLNTQDAFYEGEMNFYSEEMPKYELISKEVSEAVLACPFKGDFSARYGKNFLLDMEARIKLSDERVTEYKVEESLKCIEYNSCTSKCVTQFRGEECNFYGLLAHMLSTDRAERKEAYLKWAELYESVSSRLDEIYLNLVRLRKTMAKELGFESYPQMAYIINGHYDYGAKEVEKFRNSVIKYVVPAVQKLYEEQRKRLGVDELFLYDEELVFPDGNAKPVGDMEYLINAAKEMYEDISPETGEFFNFLTEHELFDLKTRAGKSLGGYCTFLDGYGAPFIFSNFNGSSADVDVLTHEAGHAFQAYTAYKCQPLHSLIWSTSDICEIHSMSMEHFAYPYMNKFFGDKAEKYRYAHLSGALKILPYMCLVDHFQHEVFAGDYDAKGLRSLWRRLEKTYMPWRKYDGVKFLEEGGYWMQKAHIFLNPFYYVDYALAQMGAFEYYERAKQNFKAVWKDYYNLCKAGGSKGYFELLSLGGLSNPFDENTIKRLVDEVMSEL